VAFGDGIAMLFALDHRLTLIRHVNGDPAQDQFAAANNKLSLIACVIIHHLPLLHFLTPAILILFNLRSTNILIHFAIFSLSLSLSPLISSFSAV
jgi:hypothetical protein